MIRTLRTVAQRLLPSMTVNNAHEAIESLAAGLE